MTGSTQTLHALFKNALRMTSGTKSCAPEHVYLHCISGCLKEKVIGFTKGRLCLAILFAFSEERAGFLDSREPWWSFPWKSAKLSASSPTISMLAYYGLDWWISR